MDEEARNNLSRIDFGSEQLGASGFKLTHCQ
jgi:hypothetical protein